MADWSKPTITSNYVTFVDEVKNRDIDAITLQLNALVNPPVGSIRLLRSPTKFQEWDGTQFVDKILSVAGGGTGSSTPAGGAANLGLGSMAFQNSNAVAITGGALQTVTLTNVSSYVSFNHSGGQAAFTAGTGTVAIVAQGSANNYSLYIVGADVANQSYGMYIVAGSGADYALAVINRAQTRHALLVNGNMVVSIPWRLVVPVGVDYWA